MLDGVLEQRLQQHRRNQRHWSGVIRIDRTGEPLPESERLLSVEWPSYIREERAVEREAEALEVLEAALNEVAALLVRLRGEGSRLTL